MPVLSETLVTFDRLKSFIQQTLIAVGLPIAAINFGQLATFERSGALGHVLARRL